MNEPIIILQGITLDQFRSILKEEIRAEIQSNDAKKVRPLSKTEAGEQLGVSYKTLVKIMSEMNIDTIFPADIDRILLKFPKYIKKSIRA